MDVQKKINEYEAYKTRLEEESLLPGVKGLKAKNELAQLHASPLAEELRRLLITSGESENCNAQVWCRFR